MNMSEKRDVRKYAGWYGSYINDDQGRCLVECMDKKIKADDVLFDKLNKALDTYIACKTDVGLFEEIESILKERQIIQHKIGYLIWEV